MAHGYASQPPSDRKQIPQRVANLATFHRKSCNSKRIVTAKNRVKYVASCPLMQLQHQSRLQPLGQARRGGECPFFAKASLPPGVGTIVCVPWGEKVMCRCGSIPPPPSLGELYRKYRNTNGSCIVIQIGCVYTTFCQEEGMLLQKYRDRNGRCIAILLQKYWGQGSARLS